MGKYSATAEQHEVIGEEHKTFFLENEVHATQHNINSIETARDNLYTYLAERSQLSISDPYFFELKDNQLWGKGCNLPMVDIVKIPLYSSETKFIERTKAEVEAMEKIERFAIEAPEGAAFIEISPTSPEYPGYIASMIRIGVKEGNKLRCTAITIPEKSAEESLKNMQLFREFFPPVQQKKQTAEQLIANPLFFTTVESKEIQLLLRDDSGKFVENNFYILAGEILSSLKRNSVEEITEPQRIAIVQEAQATIQQNGKPKMLVVGDEKALFHKTKELLETKGIFGDPEKSLVDHYLESLRYPLTEFPSQDYLFMVLNIQDILREQYNNGVRVQELEKVFKELDLRELTYQPAGGGGNEVGGVSVLSIDPGILSDLKKKALENEEKFKAEENQLEGLQLQERELLFVEGDNIEPVQVISPTIAIFTLPQIQFIEPFQQQSLDVNETKNREVKAPQVVQTTLSAITTEKIITNTLEEVGQNEEKIEVIPVFTEIQPVSPQNPYRALELPVEDSQQVTSKSNKQSTASQIQTFIVQALENTSIQVEISSHELVNQRQVTVQSEVKYQKLHSEIASNKQIEITGETRQSAEISTTQSIQHVEIKTNTTEVKVQAFEIEAAMVTETAGIRERIVQTGNQQTETVSLAAREYEEIIGSQQAENSTQSNESRGLELASQEYESGIRIEKEERHIETNNKQNAAVEAEALFEERNITTQNLESEQKNRENKREATSESIKTTQNEVSKKSAATRKNKARASRIEVSERPAYSQNNIKSATMDRRREELPASRFQTIKPRVVKIGMNLTTKAESQNNFIKKKSLIRSTTSQVIPRGNDRDVLADHRTSTRTQAGQNHLSSTTSSFMNPRSALSQHKQVMHAHVEEEVNGIKNLFERLKSQGEIIVTKREAEALTQFEGITIENNWQNTDYARVQFAYNY